MIKRLPIYLLSLFCSLSSFNVFAQDTLNVMSYNLYRFPYNPPTNRVAILRDILDYQKVDVLLACEIITEQGANDILQSAFTNRPDEFGMGTFLYSDSAASDPLQQMVYYNKSKLVLYNEGRLLTATRDINYFTFIPNVDLAGLDTNFLHVFVTHLKSSEGPANRALRTAMIDTFLQFVNQHPNTNQHSFIIGGDFNLYQSGNEDAYQHLIANQPKKFVDPLNAMGTWHDNANFKSMHTQSTRVSNTGFGSGGSGGGLDDRFDFMFYSDNMSLNQNYYQYVTNSFVSVGNNGDCFNKSVNDTSCTGVYPQWLRNRLYNMSDHLPVFMKVAMKTDGSTAIPNVPTSASLRLIGSNVVKDELLFEVSNTLLTDIADIALCDIVGTSYKLNFNQLKANNFSVDISHLKSGMYLLTYKGAFLKFVKY